MTISKNATRLTRAQRYEVETMIESEIAEWNQNADETTRKIASYEMKSLGGYLVTMRLADGAEFTGDLQRFDCPKCGQVSFFIWYDSGQVINCQHCQEGFTTIWTEESEMGLES